MTFAFLYNEATLRERKSRITLKVLGVNSSQLTHGTQVDTAWCGVV